MSQTSVTANLTVTGLYSLTPLHCGVGQVAGAIDLPIARDAHTGFPIIPSTSLKGVMRDLLKRRAPEHVSVEDLLGSEPGPNAETQAGTLVVLDACILLLPVRSLRGVYRQVTCPMAIRLLNRLCEALSKGWKGPAVPTVEAGHALVAKGGEPALSLEDLVYQAERVKSAGAVDELAKFLGPLVSSNEKDADRLELTRRIAVVDDEVFQDLCRRTTPVSARIALDSESKTSRNLWYEETLPPDTLFGVIWAVRPGETASHLSTFREALIDRGSETAENVIQIGGNESVGQGFCRWTLRSDDSPAETYSREREPVRRAWPRDVSLNRKRG
ncbi:MAG: type III-B CRISPR module RAMP protein Cmr4 [Candidatus Wallbacteria bacterium]|nr:type III-B CRISPR module RAMP protein Cmr4 [Candidatus Wallbacteria bacterium]